MADPRAPLDPKTSASFSLVDFVLEKKRCVLQFLLVALFRMKRGIMITDNISS